MSAQPRRRHSPAVYRRRRLAVLLLLLVVIAGIVLVIWQPWQAAPIQDAGATTPGTSSAADTSPSSTDASTPPTSGTATGSSTPSTDAIAACTSANVTVVAVTDKESYGSGAKPQLSIELTNEGVDPCLIDVGTAAQSFVITSGVDVWWRSTDCQSEPSSQVVQLDAGQTAATKAPLEWDRTRSSTSTCDGNRPNAGAGYYRLTVSIGGIESEPTQFELR